MVYSVLSRRGSGGIMIDVGAHYGSSLEKFSRAGWQIHAFEPDRENRRVLESKFQKSPNVHIDPRALSDSEQKSVSFYRSNVSTGISGLSAFHESHRKVECVDTIRLDKYLEQNSISRVNFLKIDTEGFDIFVLKGLNLKKTQPDVIVCEFEDRKTVPLGYSFHDLADYLQNQDYFIFVSEWYPIIRYGGRHRWRDFKIYPCVLEDENGWGNLIAIKENEIFNRLCKVAKKAKLVNRAKRILTSGLC